jgi:predicted nucleotidyltransferase component of viral defense system
MLARKGRGTDIVFDQTESIRLSGPISSGAEIDLDIKVANVTACFVMKGIALGERTSEKDAYDLYMLARYYKEGPESVLSELKKLGNHGLMNESLRYIEEQFKDIKSIGPVSVATFMGITDKEEFDRVTRDAYELLQFVIQGMSKNEQREKK